MKTATHLKVPLTKYGRIVLNNHDLTPQELETIHTLSSFGFDIETIIPSNIPKSHNPDLLMLGTFWEMKGPTSSNEATIKKRFRKAIKQSSGKAIFDLNNITQSEEKTNAKRKIISLFETSRGMRRIMIIENKNSILDILK